MDFANMQIGKYHNLIARSNLYIKSVEFDIESKKGFNPVKLEINPDAAGDTLTLEKVRGVKTTEKERQTYIVLDSLAKEANFDKWLEVFTILSTGKIPIGFISLPIERLTNFNQQEGFRLGLGAETNSRFSRVVTLGGYFAYGFRDKEWKWGGNLGLTFDQKKQIKLDLTYKDDLFERGGVNYQKDEFDLIGRSLYRNFFINRLDRERNAGVSLSGLVTPNFRLRFIGNYRRINLTDDYAYVPFFNGPATSTDFDLAETGVIITWNIREQIMMLGDRRVSLGSKFPKINLIAVKGLDNLFEASYDYYRFKLDIEQNFTIRGFGKLTLYSRNGLSLGSIPLSLRHIMYGTGKNWNLIVPNTFETMQPAEFYSDAQSSFFLRFTFLPLKNKTTWTEPLFSVHSAAGIGMMSDRNAHLNYNFKVPEKGYFESGLIIDNIFKSGFSGFGGGVFYRYGPYSFENPVDNLVYKISITYNL